MSSVVGSPSAAVNRHLLLDGKPLSHDLFLGPDAREWSFINVGGPSFWEQNLAHFKPFVEQPPKDHALLECVPSFVVIGTVLGSLLVLFGRKFFDLRQSNNAVLYPLI